MNDQSLPIEKGLNGEDLFFLEKFDNPRFFFFVGHEYNHIGIKIEECAGIFFSKTVHHTDCHQQRRNAHRNPEDDEKMHSPKRPIFSKNILHYSSRSEAINDSFAPLQT